MQIRVRKAFLVVLNLVFLVLSVSLIHAHGEKMAEKKGILLVAFGSSIPEAQVSFDNIERSVKEAFPEIPVRWAYTSRIIIAKMAKEGKRLVTPEEALAGMMREKFTHVAVQSLHTIPGEEFHGVVENARRFAGMSKGLKRVPVGYPLLTATEDVDRVAKAILKVIPKERQKQEAVVLMGHGTRHPANVYYAALAYRLQKTDPNIFVGTVEGWPEIDEIKEDLTRRRIRKVYLMPFMSVAGDHARNDMAGPEEDSWKSILEKEGITCVPVLKGTAEFQEFVDIWVDHLKDAFGDLDK